MPDREVQSVHVVISSLFVGTALAVAVAGFASGPPITFSNALTALYFLVFGIRRIRYDSQLSELEKSYLDPDARNDSTISAFVFIIGIVFYSLYVTSGLFFRDQQHFFSIMAATALFQVGLNLAAYFEKDRRTAIGALSANLFRRWAIFGFFEMLGLIAIAITLLPNVLNLIQSTGSKVVPIGLSVLFAIWVFDIIKNRNFLFSPKIDLNFRLLRTDMRYLEPENYFKNNHHYMAQSLRKFDEEVVDEDLAFLRSATVVFDLGCGDIRYRRILTNNEVNYLGVDYADIQNIELPRNSSYINEDFFTWESRVKCEICFLNFVASCYPVDSLYQLLNTAKGHLEPGGLLVFSDVHKDYPTRIESLIVSSEDNRSFTVFHYHSIDRITEVASKIGLKLVHAVTHDKDNKPYIYRLVFARAESDFSFFELASSQTTHENANAPNSK
jgi:SAM-dependent methyltransferase